jgi:hypothetical protein
MQHQQEEVIAELKLKLEEQNQVTYNLIKMNEFGLDDSDFVYI